MRTCNVLKSITRHIGIWLNFNTQTMKTCDECANYECDNFDGIGWCLLSNEMVWNDDAACERYVEQPDDGENNNNAKGTRIQR